jgi:hypothetical protein
MPILAAITLRTAADWRRLVDLVRPLAGPLASRGTPLRVLVAEKRASRRVELSAFMWAGVLDQIARQLCIGGQWFSAEAIHEQLKRECLPDRCASGVEKWQYHADDTRSLRMSTTDLDDDEFSDYLLAIQGRAASEWGVVFAERDEA